MNLPGPIFSARNSPPIRNMPELPEVEVLVRHLAARIPGQTIRGVDVHRARSIAPTSLTALRGTIQGATFVGVTRRAKYLLFELQRPRSVESVRLVGHLGMTGRMYLLAAGAALPKHAAVVLQLQKHRFVYEDVRGFGRLTLDDSSLSSLGPEPLGAEFSVESFGAALGTSAQAIKVKLLDQSLVAGIGNIYASESLFRAGISPRLAARRLRRPQIERLYFAIRTVLEEAIASGTTMPLDFTGGTGKDGLFYYGSAEDNSEFYQERLLVYDRLGKPCHNCQTPIKRILQAARSTFFCPECQRS